jgi:hypothetical protein
VELVRLAAIPVGSTLMLETGPMCFSLGKEVQCVKHGTCALYHSVCRCTLQHVLQNVTCVAALCSTCSKT